MATFRVHHIGLLSVKLVVSCHYDEQKHPYTSSDDYFPLGQHPVYLGMKSSSTACFDVHTLGHPLHITAFILHLGRFR